MLNQYYQGVISILRTVKDLTLDGALGWPDEPLQQVEEVDLLRHIDDGAFIKGLCSLALVPTPSPNGLND